MAQPALRRSTSPAAFQPHIPCGPTWGNHTTTTQTPRILHGGPGRLTARTVSPRVRGWAAMVTAGLIAQVLLGAATADLVEIPATGDPFAGVTPQGLLAAHVAVGTFVGVAAVVVMGLALRAHHRFWIAAATIGLRGALLSMLCGHLFLVTHGAEWASVTMAGGCAVSLTACIVGLASARGQ